MENPQLKPGKDRCAPLQQSIRVQNDYQHENLTKPDLFCCLCLL